MEKYLKYDACASYLQNGLYYDCVLANLPSASSDLPLSELSECTQLMAENLETNWTTIYIFNVVVYSVMLFNLLFLVIGIAFECCAILGLITIILSAIAQIAATVVMGLFLYSDDG